MNGRQMHLSGFGGLEASEQISGPSMRLVLEDVSLERLSETKTVLQHSYETMNVVCFARVKLAFLGEGFFVL